MIKLLFCILFGFLNTTLAHAELIDSDTIFKVQGYPQPVKYLISAFGPRDPQGTGSRFHQGIDLLIPEGQLISAQQSGTISAINNYGSKEGGKNIIVNFNDGTFTFQHIFADGNEPNNKSGMTFYPNLMIISNALVTSINGGKNTYQNCNAIFDYTDSKIKRVLVDSQCALKIPPTINMSIMTPALITGTWTVTNKVAKGMNLAVVGRSGTNNKPHLHLNYFVKAKSNPLFLLKHGVNQLSPSLPFNPKYKSSFVDNPQLGNVLDTPTFQSTDLPKNVWVQIDFSQGYDLDSIDFVFDQNNPPYSIMHPVVDDHYALGGIPNSQSFPSSIAPLTCNAKDKSKCTIQVGSNIKNNQSAIYSAPTLQANGYRKSLVFNVQLPTGLIGGDHILTVNSRSVNGITQSQNLPFKITANVVPAWNGVFNFKRCDAIRGFGDGYQCNAHGGFGFGSYTTGFFSLALDSHQPNNMVFKWQINDGTYSFYQYKTIAFDQNSTTFDIPVIRKSLDFIWQYRKDLDSPYESKIWPGLDEINLIHFKITNRTLTHLEGSFSGSNTYYRFTDDPYALYFGHLETAIANFSGVWSASLDILPVITGIDGYDGCGYIAVLGKWAAANIIQAGIPSEGGPVCQVK